VPRSYIQSLNDRIRQLTAELALRQQRSATTSRLAHVSVPKPGSELYLDLSFSSQMTKTVFEVLSVPEDWPNPTIQDHPIEPKPSRIDRTVLTPSVVRFLLARYDAVIKPVYGIAIPQISDLCKQDDSGPSVPGWNMNIKMLPSARDRFQILMACAIAAASESHRTPSWATVAQMCRDWADELVTPVISALGEDSLTGILLLLVYELAGDTSRGALWELLDLAIRSCLQLGLLRSPPHVEAGQTGLRLVATLRDIEA
jgi:hypothetical protein